MDSPRITRKTVIPLTVTCPFWSKKRAKPTKAKDLSLTLTSGGETPQEAGESGLIFDGASAKLFCAINFEGPPDTVLKAAWMYVDTAEEVLIDSNEISVPHNDQILFSLSRPDNGWPVGNYEFRLFIDNELKITKPFKIPPKHPAVIRSATFCTAVGDDDMPLDEVEVFAPATQMLYCSVAIDGDDITLIKSAWFYLDAGTGSESETEYEIGALDAFVKGPGRVVFNLSRPEKGWPPGGYELRLVINEELKLAKGFRISST